MRAYLCAAQVRVAVRLVESCPTCQLHATSQPLKRANKCWCICQRMCAVLISSCHYTLTRIYVVLKCVALGKCFKRPDRSITPLATAHEHGRSLCSLKDCACKVVLSNVTSECRGLTNTTRLAWLGSCHGALCPNVTYACKGMACK